MAGELEELGADIIGMIRGRDALGRFPETVAGAQGFLDGSVVETDWGLDITKPE
jgi:hypothetical protein